MFKTENAAPELVQVNRHDRRIEPIDDSLEAALERQKVSRAADSSFSEDADDLAFLQLLPRALQRLNDVATIRG